MKINELEAELDMIKKKSMELKTKNSKLEEKVHQLKKVHTTHIILMVIIRLQGLLNH